MFVVMLKNERQNMSTQTLTSQDTDRLSEHEIVSREQWLVARKDLLTHEKQLTRLRDEVSRQRRELPWVKIDKEYVFEAPEGEVTLAELQVDNSKNEILPGSREVGGLRRSRSAFKRAGGVVAAYSYLERGSANYLGRGG
jgi:hypothetical protein